MLVRTRTPAVSARSPSPRTTAGKVTGHASSTLSVAGSAPFTVATDGEAPNSGDAVKTFVDANIQITPNGVNRVGQTHTFTAHVNINAGDGNGFVAAPNGTQISFTMDSGPGAFTTTNPCTTAGGNGLLHDRPQLGGHGCDDGERAHDGDGRWCAVDPEHEWGGCELGSGGEDVGERADPDRPNATNEVGAPHTFTVTCRRTSVTGTGSSRRRVSTSTSR